MKNRAVFFEEITWSLVPALIFCLLRGDQVMVFDFEMNLKRTHWLARLINQGEIDRIFIEPNSAEHGDSIDLAEALYNSTNSRKLPEVTALLYQDRETDLVFKRELLNDIFRWICINKYLGTFGARDGVPRKQQLILGRSWGNVRRFNTFFRGSGRQITTAIMPLWAAPFGLLAYASVWARYYAASIYCIAIYSLLALLGRLRNPDQRKQLDFVIAVEQPFLTKFKGQRSYDFLLDAGKIDQSNTLFLIGRFASDDWIGQQEARGNQLARFDEVYKPGIFRGADRQYFTLAMAWCLAKSILNQSLAPAASLSAFAKSLRAYINCSHLVSRLSVKNYIYTNNESSDQIAANIFLRRNGCKTWYYLIFLVGGYPRSRDSSDFSFHRNKLWAFLNPDCLIAMNKDVVRYFKLHRQQVKTYWVLGSIYSETVRQNLASINKGEVVRLYFPRDTGTQKKVCAFFDTTFVDEQCAFANFEDGRRFYEHILQLLDSRNDILVVIKPSKAESYFNSPTGQWSSLEKGPRIIHLMNILKEHPRVHYAGDAGDIPTIMAMSDIVVTHCMSSTTAEALGARKKAFWYEAGEKHKDLLYDHLPGLVVHGYKALEDRIEDLLYRISDKEYDHYLDQKIKGKVESHLDGLALTRFRMLLTQSQWSDVDSGDRTTH